MLIKPWPGALQTEKIRCFKCSVYTALLPLLILLSRPTIALRCLKEVVSRGHG